MKPKIRLQDELVTLEVDLQNGARISRFDVHRHGKMIPVIWNPKSPQKPDEWQHGGIPLLFPFAGRVWDQEEEGFYRIGDCRFPMPIHGFSHLASWELECKTDSSLSAVLKSNADTLRYYPWNFELKLFWILENGTLKFNVQVKNEGCVLEELNNHKMPVALGLHPYFSTQNGSINRIEVDAKAEDYICVARDGNIGLRSTSKQNNFSVLDEPSFILNGLQSESTLVHLFKDEVEDVQVELKFKERQNLVFWSDNKSEYYCIEPWMGLPNSVSHEEGLEWLETGEEFEWQGELMITQT